MTCQNCPPGFLCFDCEAEIDARVVALQHATGIRRYAVGQSVRAGDMEGRIVRHVGVCKLNEIGLAGPYYLVALQDESNLIYDETELAVTA
jgi:hypothetical protein